jgi:hypothetical protein
MRAKDAVIHLAAGSVAQALVPGAYAWAATVAPVAWSRGGNLVSKVAALAALLALAGGWWGERRWGARFRAPALWGFLLFCALAWSATPSGLAPMRVDVLRGVTGTLAWALFAFAWAAPVREAAGGEEPSRVSDQEPPLVPRKRVVGRDGYLLVAGGLAAVAIQVIGWDVPGPERSLLVRLVGLAAGLGLIDASAEVALARYGRRAEGAPAARLRAARLVLALLGLLAAGGIVFAVRG